MDFIRIIRSLEELLYDVTTWLAFYPRTMWRIVARPDDAPFGYRAGRRPRQAVHGHAEPAAVPDADNPDREGIGLPLGIEKTEPATTIAKTLLESERNRLNVGSLLFSLFALMGATTAVARRGLTLDRSTLRGPFYSRCYLTAPFPLVIAVASSLPTLPARESGPAAAAVALAGAVWCLCVETMWFGLELSLAAAAHFSWPPGHS